MKLFVAAVALMLLGISGAALAVSVDYTVTGWGPTQFPAFTTPPDDAPHMLDGHGYPGDTLELVGYSGTLDLTPGSYTQKISTLLWTIDYTYGGSAISSDQSGIITHNFNLNPLSIISFTGGPSGSLIQAGMLDVFLYYDMSVANDMVDIATGFTSTFMVQDYQVDVTPLTFGSADGTNFNGPAPWVQPQMDIYAKFDVTAVPEPTSFSALLVGLGAYISLRRRKA